jgi:small nuclear ribonucleoprotein (snRNP)-like protein
MASSSPALQPGEIVTLALADGTFTSGRLHRHDEKMNVCLRGPFHAARTLAAAKGAAQVIAARAKGSAPAADEMAAPTSVPEVHALRFYRGDAVRAIFAL